MARQMERPVGLSAPDEPDGDCPIEYELDEDRVGDDLRWIMDKFAVRVLADVATLSWRLEGESDPDILMSIHRSPSAIANADLPAILNHVGEGVGASERLWWSDVPGSLGAKKAMTMAVAKDGMVRLSVTAIYRNSNKLQDIAAEHMARKLQPVLAGYFRLWLFARKQQRRLASYQSAIDTMDIAVIILDSNGDVITQNAAGAAIFSSDDMLRKSRTSLMAANRLDSLKLHSAIDRAIEGRGETTLISLRRNGTNRPVMLLVAPVAKRPEIASDPSCVLCVYDPEQDLRKMLGPVFEAYALTRTEGHLVDHLVAGLTLAKAASRMRIAEPTARSYLKNIFAKTETNRQSDLIRLMLLSVARTYRIDPALCC